jgi:catalase
MPSKPSPVIALIGIGFAVAVAGAAFAFAAGFLSPGRLTPDKLVDALTPPTVDASGHRRNHAKGVCFTGVLDSNGNGTELSKAMAFARGQYPVIGRLNLGTPDPNAADATVRVRGIGVEIKTPDGQEWRSAMIDPPFFPVATPQAFYELLVASSSKDQNAMPAFAAAHPEIAAFGAWAKSAPFMESYAQNRFHSLNSFIFTDGRGQDRLVRWSLIPEAAPVAVPAEDLSKRAPDFLEEEIATRIRSGPVIWKLTVTVANPGDPSADPSKAWAEDRHTLEVGTLSAQQIIPEANGPCRDINFDPTVLPSGIKTSDDPFPAARSAAYAKSFDRRSAEAASYPRQQEGQK